MSKQIGTYLKLSAQNLVLEPLSQPADIYTLIVYFIIITLFYYFAFSLLRRMRIRLRMELIPGIFFGISLGFVNMNSLFYYVILDKENHKGNTNTFTKSFHLAKEISFLSQIYYFKSILNVLICFDVPGTKILNIIVQSLRYSLYLCIICTLILVFIDIEQKIPSFHDYENFYSDFLHYFELVIICFCYIILAMTFIFSHINSYLPAKVKKLMKVAMFLYPLAIFLGEMCYETFAHHQFQIWILKNPRRNLYIKQSFRIFYSFADFLTLFFMVWILSKDELNDDQSIEITELNISLN